MSPGAEDGVDHRLAGAAELGAVALLLQREARAPARRRASASRRRSGARTRRECRGARRGPASRAACSTRSPARMAERSLERAAEGRCLGAVEMQALDHDRRALPRTRPARAPRRRSARTAPAAKAGRPCSRRPRASLPPSRAGSRGSAARLADEPLDLALGEQVVETAGLGPARRRAGAAPSTRRGTPPLPIGSMQRASAAALAALVRVDRVGVVAGIGIGRVGVVSESESVVSVSSVSSPSASAVTLGERRPGRLGDELLVGESGGLVGHGPPSLRSGLAASLRAGRSVRCRVRSSRAR